MAKLDKEYTACINELLAVYEKPLAEHEPVVRVDKKPLVLHQEVRPAVAMQPGRMARRDSEYRRCGTANVFCGVEPKAGRHFTKLTANRSSPEFADYLLDIAEHCPAAAHSPPSDSAARSARTTSPTAPLVPSLPETTPAASSS